MRKPLPRRAEDWALAIVVGCGVVLALAVGAAGWALVARVCRW